MTRLFLIVVSALATVGGSLVGAKIVLEFFATWSFGLLGVLVAVACTGWIYARSFRVLTDRSVKTYFGA